MGTTKSKGLPTVEQQTDVLMKRARAGDREAARELLDLFERERTGGAAVLQQIVIDDALGARASLFRAVWPEDELYKLCVEREAAKKQKEIEGENPTTLERMLAGQIVQNWLLLQITERLFAMNWKQNEATIDALGKRLDRVQKRFLAAVKTLAQVRRLQSPTPTAVPPDSFPPLSECVPFSLVDREPITSGS